ncbi:MAG: hypothetical protein JSU57_03270 [Candidatus Heimdallarchaeota archaeon]|nr:MAG: hypothetical protein JSU57_03270 [Candidatus Heimdallarchaeota archaeon]
MSKERRYISQRKIRRIKRPTDDSSFELESEPSVTKPQGLAPNTKMYYTKVCFGVGSGTATGLLFLMANVSPELWILILIGSLIVCVTFVRYGLKIADDQIDQKRLWLSGTFTFVILFIVFTSLVWMLKII